MAGRQWLWYQLVLVFLVQGALASLQNFTIDDADKSTRYSAHWRTACPFTDNYQYACPNLDETNDGTLHWTPPALTGDSLVNITIHFTGTAVYVYNVLANFPELGTNIAFTLDGSPVGSYEQREASEGDYIYRQLVYANASLSHGSHVLAIIAGKSLVIFDYIQYTVESDGSPPAMPHTPSPSATSSPLPPTGPESIMSTSTTTTPQNTTPLVAPPVDTATPMATDAPTSSTTDAPMSSTTGVLTSTTMGVLTTDTTATMATASSQRGSNRSAGAIAGGVVGSVLALLLLGVITLYARRRLSARRVGKGMGRLLDEGPPPLMDNADHFASSRGQFLRPTYPATRPSPDVPRSPGYTMSSIPTSPTSYGGEPPSRTYMNDGTVARILEKADRARTEWPSSTGTRAFPAAFGTMERW